MISVFFTLDCVCCEITFLCLRLGLASPPGPMKSPCSMVRPSPVGPVWTWTVQDGCITGQTTKEKPTKGNTFLIWKGGEVGDFELTLQYKMEGGNSGIQYRSKIVDEKGFVVAGYQGDFRRHDLFRAFSMKKKAGAFWPSAAKRSSSKKAPSPPSRKSRPKRRVGLPANPLQAIIKQEIGTNIA